MNLSIALWGHPRSVSTAVERSFIERADFTVFHEAFAYVYFMNEKPIAIPHKHPDPTHPRTYTAVKEMMEGARKERPVFHKDFPYHVIDHLLADSPYLRGQVNTFLIRDPEETVLSHATVNPHVTKEVLGYGELARLFDAVADMTGSAPIVINAEDLVKDASGTMAAYCNAIGIPFVSSALTWSAGDRPEWTTWKGWHTDVARSDGLSKPTQHYTVTYGERPHLRAFVDYCRPFYEHLDRFRLPVTQEYVL